MTEVIKPNDKLSGILLQEAVKEELDTRIDRAKQVGPQQWETFLSVFKYHFNNIAPLIDWSEPRGRGEVQPFPMSFVASARLAYKAVHGDYEDLKRLEDEGQPISWLKAVSETLQQEEGGKIFEENMWRSPSVSFPQRAVPLQYILPYYFGDKPIAGVDLGTGLHVALPLVNSEEFKSADFIGKADMGSVVDVNLKLGVGVDKQERDPEWVMASFPIGGEIYTQDRQLLEEGYERAIQKQDQFPFVSASLFDESQYMSTLQGDGEQKFDFAMTSFVRAQLGLENQPGVKSTIGKIVKEGGIWIDMGEELLDPKLVRNIKEWPVRVYRIQDGEPVLIGTPFFLTADQSRVLRVDSSFFVNKGADFDPLNKTYEAKINTPADIPEFHERFTRDLMEDALAMHPNGTNVLVLASGPANEVRHIPDDPRITIICADRSRELLNRAAQTFTARNNTINYVQMDVANSQDINKVKEGSCGAALLINGMIYEPVAMMNTLNHVLEYGGEAVVNFYLPGSPYMQPFFDKQIKQRGATEKDVDLDVPTANGVKTFKLKGIDFTTVKEEEGLRTLGTQVHFQSVENIREFIGLMGFEVVEESKFYFTSPDNQVSPGNETVVMTIRKP